MERSITELGVEFEFKVNFPNCTARFCLEGVFWGRATGGVTRSTRFSLVLPSSIGVSPSASTLGISMVDIGGGGLLTSCGTNSMTSGAEGSELPAEGHGGRAGGTWLPVVEGLTSAWCPPSGAVGRIWPLLKENSLDPAFTCFPSGVGSAVRIETL